MSSSIKDVAKLANVSTATVSRVINRQGSVTPATVKIVEKAIKALEYRPLKTARNLASPIGVMVADVSNTFYGELVKSIDTFARDNHRPMITTNGYHDPQAEKEGIELLIKHKCKSIIVHSHGLTDSQLISYANANPGLVIINRYIKEIVGRCVYLDNILGSKVAIQHLIDMGHRNIGYIGSSHDIADSYERLEGYKMALAENGIKFDENLVSNSGPDIEGGHEAMNNLMSKANVNITAIATYNDFMAAGVISTLKQNKLVLPRDMSVIGFDDIHVASILEPKLTTMRYPIAMMARKAAEISESLIEGSTPEIAHRFVPTLIDRASVKDIS